jgi:hypothetical protein
VLPVVPVVAVVDVLVPLLDGVVPGDPLSAAATPAHEP